MSRKYSKTDITVISLAVLAVAGFAFAGVAMAMHSCSNLTGLRDVRLPLRTSPISAGSGDSDVAPAARCENCEIQTETQGELRCRVTLFHGSMDEPTSALPPKPTPETCACAAIQFPDGMIIAGERHHNCISMINCAFGGNPPYGRDKWRQGFMTTRGRFVDRFQGQRLQLLADI